MPSPQSLRLMWSKNGANIDPFGPSAGQCFQQCLLHRWFLTHSLLSGWQFSISADTHPALENYLQGAFHVLQKTQYILSTPMFIFRRVLPLTSLWFGPHYRVIKCCFAPKYLMGHYLPTVMCEARAEPRLKQFPCPSTEQKLGRFRSNCQSLLSPPFKSCATYGI